MTHIVSLTLPKKTEPETIAVSEPESDLDSGSDIRESPSHVLCKNRKQL